MEEFLQIHSQLWHYHIGPIFTILFIKLVLLRIEINLIAIDKYDATLGNYIWGLTEVLLGFCTEDFVIFTNLNHGIEFILKEFV